MGQIEDFRGRVVKLTKKSEQELDRGGGNKILGVGMEREVGR